MKNRLHDKKAGIFILVAIFILSLVDVILRATVFNDMVSTIANYGEALITAIFSVVLLAFGLKGKDRIFYILCGVWIAYFVMNQLFGIPSLIAETVLCYKVGCYTGFAGSIIHISSIICIVIIGALLIEYMNDGTIYNKAFNFFCILTILLLVALIIISQHDAWVLNRPYTILASLHDLSRIAMVFFFTIFAYDSAKKQLSKVDFDK